MVKQIYSNGALQDTLQHQGQADILGNVSLVTTKLLGVIEGAVDGIVVQGAHQIHKLVGTNGAVAGYYLQAFDGTQLPVQGAVPIAQVYVAFGIATGRARGEIDFGQRMVQTVDGIVLGWSTTSWSFTAVGSGANLGAEVYGG